MLEMKNSYQKKEINIFMHYWKDRIQSIFNLMKILMIILDNDGLEDIIGDEGMQNLNMNG